MPDKDSITLEENCRKISPLHISFGEMDVYENRRRVEELGGSPMENSFRMARVVDPTFKQTAEMAREFYYPSDDL
jgi:hypothetical protein